MSTHRPARIPEPPYCAVVFTALRTEGDHGYSEMNERMSELVEGQPGFLGVDSTRGADGFGITVAYFDTEENVLAWRRNTEHTEARNMGRKAWYEAYSVHVATVHRAYRWDRDE
ncbi:antibiotic biosynthesis monooxygenase family protein [Streptacidiphilus rugosus]|uniref:antibiotic biosynthesis monooxygenase family protein n=1 Tax=Streptacidiphilus rugosus TaxID=405783 RepID=UPI0005664AB3|nr:antibiotic biosynthesis monooxygenase [Streptacidiphilus rugosus]